MSILKGLVGAYVLADHVSLRLQDGVCRRLFAGLCSRIFCFRTFVLMQVDGFNPGLQLTKLFDDPYLPLTSISWPTSGQKLVDVGAQCTHFPAPLCCLHEPQRGRGQAWLAE